MLGSIISFIGQSYLASKNIYNIIGTVLAVMLSYKAVYYAIGFLFTRKFIPAKNKHKYAILIAAPDNHPRSVLRDNNLQPSMDKEIETDALFHPASYG